MMTHCVVRWQDGSHDNNRECIECGKVNCPYPVYKDYYKEIVTKKSYQKYMDDLNPETTFTKEWAIEPDNLIFQTRYTSPIIEDETVLQTLEEPRLFIPNQEAYNNLTNKQKLVWDAVMERGISEYDTAKELGLTRDIVHDRINKARKRYKKYLLQLGEKGDILKYD